MNTIVTSKEKILECSKEIIAEGGIETLNMRAIASKCGVALGSLYNYFPTKTDIMIAIVEDNWNKIFHPALCSINSDKEFIEVVDAIYSLAQSNFGEQDAFLYLHSSLVDKKDRIKGRTAMEAYFKQIRILLLNSLESDKNVKKDAWDSGFTKEQFVKFVFSNIITQLSRKESECEYLKKLIRRVLY